NRVGRSLRSGSTRTIGLISGLTHITVGVGTLFFRRLITAKIAVPRLLAIAWLACGAGLVILIASSSLTGVTVGSLLNGAGCGIMLPTLLTWNMSTLPAERRGLGTGAWTASFFLGNFLNPLIVLSLAANVGGRAGAVNVFGWLLLIVAVVTLAGSFTKRTPQPELAS
ncbi:MAG: MFS transporter, partial [Acidobacteriota bacterium]